MWDEIIYQIPSLDGAAIKVCENIIPLYWVCDYLSIPGLKCISANKWVPNSSTSETSYRAIIVSVWRK